MRFEVGTQDLRKAVTSLLPVITATQEPSLRRARFEVGEHTLMISGTDAQVAMVCEIGVSVWDGHPGGGRVFELTAQDFKKVLDVHHIPKGEGVIAEDVQLLVTVSGTSWRSEDGSGLFAAAEALEIPLAAPDANAPDVAAFVGEHVRTWLDDAQGAETLRFDHAPVALGLASLDKEQKAHRAPMVVRLTRNRRAAVVTIGADVVAVVVTSDHTAQARELAKENPVAAEAWTRWASVLPERGREVTVTGPSAEPAQKPPQGFGVALNDAVHNGAPKLHVVSKRPGGSE